MQVFQLWYAYYDSIFTNFPIQIPYALLNTINLQQNLTMPWPQVKKISQLTNCFQIIQKFILDEKNWIKCDSQPHILKQIQIRVNFVLTLLLIEKTYAKDYWSNNKRRIQASITHFFIILKYFILGLIPQGFNTLKQAIQNGKSCTTLSNLQTLVNQILKNIEKLRQFVLCKQFKQQKKLVFQFLMQVKDFLQNLPCYNKKKLQAIPQLVKYIQIINPIQLCKDSYQIKLKRKKVNTYANNRQSLKVRSRQDSKHRIQYYFINEHELESLKKSKSSSFQKHDYFTEELDIHLKRNESITLISVFKFNELIRKHSINYGRKKPTVTTLGTKEQRDQSNQRMKSFIKQSRQTRFKSKQKSLKKQKTSSITIRSKQSSQYIILHDNIQKQNQNERKVNQNIKNRQKNEGHNNSINYKVSEQYNFMEGRSKKWGTIRDFVNKNIAKKKIQQLLDEQLFF